MVIWTIKLLKTIKKAVAGRRYPHQLAGAVAFGCLLGIIPHGNLIALTLVILVLSLRVNHAMAGLTAIGVSYLATRLDPYSNDVGNYVLTNPDWAESFTTAWQWPVVPWTDLNNSVVMGSLIIGVAALLPIYSLSYWFFKSIAPTAADEKQQEEKTQKRMNRNVAKHSVTLVDQAHREVLAPHVAPNPQREHVSFADTSIATDHDEVADAGEHVSVETRIDVIRMKDYEANSDGVAVKREPPVETPAEKKQAPPPDNDEALNYLLRQLRDSQQRKAG